MSPPPPAQAQGPPASLVLAGAVTCGALLANLYYAQPLVGLMAPQLGISEGFAGLIVSLALAGYGLGLFFVVPLADRLENRRLILATLGVVSIALAGIALAQGAVSFCIASLLAGVCSAAAQLVMPLVASLAPPERRGRAIGQVMTGLLAGIMLARPVSALVSSWAGWRGVYAFGALLALALQAWLWRVLPVRQPIATGSYAGMLASMLRLLATLRPLQRRAWYQSLLFAAFNLFWTAVPLLLARSFGYSQREVALFALAGAAGALAAPIAGRMGDRGLLRVGTAASLASLTLAFVLAGFVLHWHSVALLLACALVIDAAVQTNQVLGLRVIYALSESARGRINSIYLSVMFACGALGSALATLALQAGGWPAAAGCGAALGALALAGFATEPRATA
jgi:predicted MFS family arabinose efflux permease